MVGLVLEGGGMRGAYTGGVLQYLMEQELYLPYVIGVSAGACQGCSYVSRQLSRNKAVTVDFAAHPEYISFKNYLRKRELFGMDLIFHDIPLKYIPFDFKTFKNSPQKVTIGVTDLETGQPHYFTKDGLSDQDLLTVVRASSSLPFMAKPVKFQGQTFMDGGIADPIPIRKSVADGNNKNIVILTRNAGYRKAKPKGQWIVKKTAQNEAFGESMLNRYQVYNDTLDYVEQEADKGNIFVIQPSVPLEVGRIERDVTKLEKLYWQGYKDAKNSYGKLVQWLGSAPKPVINNQMQKLA
ncbi:MAG: patatin family protein [Turicibacter sp.]|nr:patatin family protein [Turicibacter sp.]